MTLSITMLDAMLSVTFLSDYCYTKCSVLWQQWSQFWFSTILSQIAERIMTSSITMLDAMLSVKPQRSQFWFSTILSQIAKCIKTLSITMFDAVLSVTFCLTVVTPSAAFSCNHSGHNFNSGQYFPRLPNVRILKSAVCSGLFQQSLWPLEYPSSTWWVPSCLGTSSPTSAPPFRSSPSSASSSPPSPPSGSWPTERLRPEWYKTFSDTLARLIFCQIWEWTGNLVHSC